MTDSEAYEQVGRKRAEYRQKKTEFAQLKTKAGDLSRHAAAISAGLEHPETICWYEGMPMMGRGPQHVILTSAMFAELSEQKVRQLCDDIKRTETAIASLRVELTNIDEDPER